MLTFVGADIRIPAQDAFPLRATYASGRAGAGAVLILHQCDREGMATGLEPVEAALAAAGISVLTLDYRGYGGSITGKSQEEDVKHRGSDIAAAYQYLRERSGAKNIAVVGASCGCRRAGALAAEHPSEVKAMVCLAGSIGRPNPDPPFDQISHLPVLAIGAEKDQPWTDQMREIFIRSRHPASRFVLYKGESHGAPLLKDDPRLAQAIADWVTALLR
ncbi:MAG: alpha/beta hydrolase [Bryobacteraceae bacterium]|nr:alpha/beta hydrolase [Bryobacteraceae bacterium]